MTSICRIRRIMLLKTIFKESVLKFSIEDTKDKRAQERELNRPGFPFPFHTSAV